MPDNPSIAYVVTNRRQLGKSFSGLTSTNNTLGYLHLGSGGRISRLSPGSFHGRVGAELRSLTAVRQHPVLVLPIHGYSTTWDDSLHFFSAVDAEITRKIPGALTVGFSWSSQGRITNYIGDRIAARITAASLASGLTAALQLMMKESCPAHLVAVCHSMGNFVLAKAASYVIEDMGLRDFHLFSEVLMVAPDLDGGAFGLGGAARDLTTLSRRVTVYRSIHDGALVLSQAKRAGMTGPRLGRQGVDPHKTTPHNVVMVDASARMPGVSPIEAHSRYFHDPVILADMRQVITGRDRSAIDGRVLDPSNEYSLR